MPNESRTQKIIITETIDFAVIILIIFIATIVENGTIQSMCLGWNEFFPTIKCVAPKRLFCKQLFSLKNSFIQQKVSKTINCSFTPTDRSH